MIVCAPKWLRIEDASQTWGDMLSGVLNIALFPTCKADRMSCHGLRGGGEGKQSGPTLLSAQLLESSAGSTRSLRRQCQCDEWQKSCEACAWRRMQLSSPALRDPAALLEAAHFRMASTSTYYTLLFWQVCLKRVRPAPFQTSRCFSCSLSSLFCRCAGWRETLAGVQASQRLVPHLQAPVEEFKATKRLNPDMSAPLCQGVCHGGHERSTIDQDQGNATFKSGGWQKTGLRLQSTKGCLQASSGAWQRRCRRHWPAARSRYSMFHKLPDARILDV